MSGRNTGRVVYDLRLVRQVLDFLDNGGGWVESQRKFGVNHSTIYRWRKRRESLGYAWPSDADIQEQIAYKADTNKKRATDREYRRRRRAQNNKLRTVSPVGTVRRIRALHAIGWSQPELARRLGWSTGRVSHITGDKYNGVNIRTARKVAALYRELCMKVPPETTMTRRLRKRARQQGWAPPLAWDNIDDPNEKPAGLPSYQAPVKSKRAETVALRTTKLQEIVERGATLEAACREVNLDRNALWKWCKRHGHLDLYARLGSRSTNQYRTTTTPRGSAA